MSLTLPSAIDLIELVVSQNEPAVEKLPLSSSLDAKNGNQKGL